MAIGQPAAAIRDQDHGRKFPQGSKIRCGGYQKLNQPGERSPTTFPLKNPPSSHRHRIHPALITDSVVQIHPKMHEKYSEIID